MFLSKTNSDQTVAVAEKFGDNLLASLDDLEIVSELGLYLVDVLHYVSFSQKVEQNWSSKDTFDETIQKKIL